MAVCERSLHVVRSKFSCIRTTCVDFARTWRRSHRLIYLNYILIYFKYIQDGCLLPKTSSGSLQMTEIMRIACSTKSAIVNQNLSDYGKSSCRPHWSISSEISHVYGYISVFLSLNFRGNEHNPIFLEFFSSSLLKCWYLKGLTWKLSVY